MQKVILFNRSILVKEQIQHLCSHGAVDSYGLLLIKVKKKINYTKLLPAVLFDINVMDSFVYETNVCVKSGGSFHSVETFPDWLYVKNKNFFYVSSFMEYYLQNYFRLHFKKFYAIVIKNNSNVITDQLTNLNISIDDIYLLNMYDDFSHNSIFINLKEKIGFLIVFYFYFSCEREIQSQIEKSFKLPKMQFYRKHNAQNNYASAKNIFFKNHKRYIEDRHIRVVTQTGLNYLNRRFNQNTRLPFIEELSELRP